jgi:chromosome segregation ATPase
MKLQELAVANPTKQATKVFESYFGNSVSFDSVSRDQALGMLRRVRAVIAEHRRTPEFHRSEQNPTYLKLVVMEQALAAAAVAPATPGQTPQQAAALQSQQQIEKRKQIQDQIRDLDKQKQDLQKQLNMAEGRPSLRQRLKESEVQQAQVVLASQDMVDQVQKMSEQVSAMQFKDLPALIDSIKNEVGVDQAMQFNTDATAALAGLLQNLQGAKQQLEAAVGVVTGQAPQVPGADMAGEIPAELPAPDEAPMDLDVDVDVDAEEEPAIAGLGRERR